MGNRLFYGDNLDILRDRRYFPDECVDLIYLDPPFNSNRSYNVLFRDESGRQYRDDSIPPLRQRLAERGEGLVWIDLDGGATTSVVFSLGTAMPHTHYSADVRAAALEMRISGMTVLAIGIELGINQATISRWIRQTQSIQPEQTP